MLDLKTATLRELEAASNALSAEICELQDQRRPIDAEISSRHDVIKALQGKSPQEVDEAILKARGIVAEGKEVEVVE
jgi:prefoldin subunit 5